MAEMTEADVIFNNFNLIVDSNDLLFCLTTKPIVEFQDSRPANFIIYQMIVTIGLLVDPSDFSKCFFHLDYFEHNPLDIIFNDCQDNNDCPKFCAKNKSWCTNCLGKISASNINLIMHPSIKFSNVPLYSVIDIKRECNPIDFDDIESLRIVSEFIQADLETIYSIQKNVDTINEKIRKITESLIFLREIQQQIMNTILARRGNSLDSYTAMLQHFQVLVDTDDN